MLRSPALPNMGLLGTYFAGDQLQGPVLTVRKDLLVGADAELPWPYSVRWEGKLAASRAGEYMISALADGFVQVYVDGQLLINHLPDQINELNAGSVDSVYAEGVIYLEQGWHDISILFAPDSREAGLRLLWHPPGSAPGPLPSGYLSPVLPDVHGDDLALPPPPDLLDPRLGDDQFALTQGVELRQAAIVIPPGPLPAFSPELVWQVANGCGRGDDQLDWPHGLAFDPQGGRLFVADTGNRRVLAFGPTGELEEVFADQAFEEPFDVEISREGLPLVLDALAQQISRIDPASGSITPLEVDTGFYRPRGIGVDEAGNILVADTGGGRVAMLSPTGDYLVGMGGPETEIGQGQPVDAMAVANTPWTVTAEDGRIWRLDISGTLVALPRSTTLDGPQLAGLPDGSFFVTDPVRQLVQYHSSAGQPLRQWAYAGLFDRPTGIAAKIGNDDMVQIAVTDSAACSVSLWRLPAVTLEPPLSE
ncbi:MAG: hypothetical protein HC802_14955 [Caldilineaceae bacterium]|nr:hypothetical protein [Caldilineaceae bacterium]